ncbi:MAG TPA: hypothetical protein PKM59_12505 [Thermodesulfobacteriota bacterium]|nr:hypothetical protein [Thermodesulfobacteriota bacterium]
MKKEMYEITVSTDGGVIAIDGREPGSEEYDRVKFPPEQVETIVQWLKEAKDELLASKSIENR